MPCPAVQTSFAGETTVQTPENKDARKKTPTKQPRKPTNQMSGLSDAIYCGPGNYVPTNFTLRSQHREETATSSDNVCNPADLGKKEGDPATTTEERRRDVSCECGNLSKEDKKAAITVMMISISFLILTASVFFCSQIYVVTEPPMTEIEREFIRTLASTLQCINNSINFFFYIRGDIFCAAFKKRLSHWWHFVKRASQFQSS